MRNLDALPWMDREAIKVASYRPSPLFYRKLPHTAVMTSRGCPHECAFCCSDRRLRKRAVEDVIDEINWLKNRHGIMEVTFYDEAFTLDRDRAARFCEIMLEKGIKLSWSANSRVDCVDLPLLRIMKKAGCWRILYGLESGVDKNLRAVAKGATVQQGREAVRLTNLAGIESLGTFLFGIPGESFRDGLETIRFATSLKLDYALFLHLCPLPGSSLYKKIFSQYNTTNFASMTGFIPCFDSACMTRSEQEKLMETAFRRFYFRIPYFLRRLGAIRSVGDVIRHAQGLGLML